MLLLDSIPSGPRMNKNAGQEYKENFQDPSPPTGKELQEIQQRESKDVELATERVNGSELI